MTDNYQMCMNCGENEPGDEIFSCNSCENMICELCAWTCKNCGKFFCDSCKIEHKTKCK